MDNIFANQPSTAEMKARIDGFGGWFEIDLDQMSANLAAMRARLGPDVEIMPVVKNNAYGHGLRPICTALVEDGIKWVMVAKYDEAVAIKTWGLETDVLLMDAVYTDQQVQRVIELGITLVVYTEEMAQRLDAAAASLGKSARVFVKVDTGLRRVGVFHEDAVAFITKLAGLAHVDLCGTFSSFMQDEKQDSLIAERFGAVLDGLKKAGIDPGIRSMASTHGILHYHDSWLDMVRPAMSLFGVYPTPGDKDAGLELGQILTMKARVEQVKSVEKGASVTYFGRYIAPRDMQIATTHVGFYDALPREMANQGTVIANGTACDSVGSVSLNHYLFDATDADIAVGDVVTIIGAEGENDLLHIARKAGWMVYSLMNHLNPFVPRVYLRNGEPVAIYQPSM